MTIRGCLKRFQKRNFLQFLVHLRTSALVQMGGVRIFMGCCVLVEMGLRVIKEVKCSEEIHGSLKSNFIALIPKSDNLISIDDCKPISLCKCVYKIIVNVSVVRFKNISERSFL